MKKSLVILLILFSSTVVFGHCGSCGIGDDKKPSYLSKRHDKKHAFRVKQLNLNVDQQKAYDKIHTQFKQDKKALKENYKSDLKDVLTEDQFKTYFKRR